MCVAIFIVTALQARSLTDIVWQSPLAENMVLWGPLVNGPGYIRALAAGFLHLDITHLFLNMLLLVLVGAEIERAVGTGPYTVAYLAFILGSSAAVLAFNFAVPTAGASGALYALMAVLVALAYRRSLDLRAPLILITVNVVYTLISTNVSFWGHAGGLLWGAVMGLGLTSAKQSTRWATAWLGLAVAVIGVWIPTIPMSTMVL